jgi:hypothetical protein
MNDILGGDATGGTTAGEVGGGGSADTSEEM